MRQLPDMQGPNGRRIMEITCEECHIHTGWLFIYEEDLLDMVVCADVICDDCYPPGEAPNREV